MAGEAPAASTLAVATDSSLPQPTDPPTLGLEVRQLTSTDQAVSFTPDSMRRADEIRG
jgi:hypothetical protein